jgi:hypothetical protein
MNNSQNSPKRTQSQNSPKVITLTRIYLVRILIGAYLAYICKDLRICVFAEVLCPQKEFGFANAKSSEHNKASGPQITNPQIATFAEGPQI